MGLKVTPSVRVEITDDPSTPGNVLVIKLKVGGVIRAVPSGGAPTASSTRPVLALVAPWDDRLVEYVRAMARAIVRDAFLQEDASAWTALVQWLTAGSSPRMSDTLTDAMLRSAQVHGYVMGTHPDVGDTACVSFDGAMLPFPCHGLDAWRSSSPVTTITTEEKPV